MGTGFLSCFPRDFHGEYTAGELCRSLEEPCLREESPVRREDSSESKVFRGEIEI